MEARPGAPLGSRYELVGLLGSGSMGQVWQALDHDGDQSVAVKLLHPHHARDTDLVARFLNEFVILASLNHPNIVTVRDRVVEGDTLAIVMDLIPGGSLRAHQERFGVLPAGPAVGLAAATLDALAHAHGHSPAVLHRDVKPDNVLLARADRPGPEDVRLSDFGIARLVLDGARDRTVQAGTPHYMAPEICLGDDPLPASDVYSAGILLYELLAGRTPFAGPGNINKRHLNASPPPLPLQRDLWELIAQMLDKDPGRRPSAAQAAHDLRCLPAVALDGPALPAQPDPDAWEAASTPPVRPAPSRSASVPGAARAPAALLHHLRRHSTPPAEAPPEAAGATTVDPNATGLAARRPSASSPTGPPTDSPAPAAADPGATRISTAFHHDIDVALPAAGPVRRRRWIVAAAAAVVVVVAGLLIWRPWGGSADEPPVTEQTPSARADLSFPVLDTGLRIALSAEWDASASATRLSVTLTAQNNSLAGDILLALPPPAATSDTATPEAGSAACPTLALDAGDAATHNLTTLAGLDISPDIPCQYRLSARPSGDSLASDDAIPFPANNDVGLRLTIAGPPPADYGDWLEQVTRDTSQALEDKTGGSYPLQRVTGLTVQAQDLRWPDDPNDVNGRTVRYNVVAEGLDADNTVFSSDTSPGADTPLLDALTGGQGFDPAAVSLIVCQLAHVSRPPVVLADQQGD
ncbi:MAG: protein kinase, partial [Propionibacteriaceae bacterium]|nr:protein kinase [Propionibacteriaceae bacterium]